MDAHRVELIDYLHVIRRRAIVMLIIIVVCVAGAFGATALQHKTYAANSVLIVNGSSSIGAQAEIQDRELAVQRAQAFAQIAQTEPAIAAAMTRADKKGGPFTSNGGVSVTTSADGTSPFIYITVKGSDPVRLAAIANAFTTTLPKTITKLNQAPAFVADSVTILQPATVPSTPISPHPTRNIAFGIGIGVVLAFLAAFVRETLDRRMRDSEEVEKATKLPVLGVVPLEDSKSPVPVVTEPHSARAEAYRKVRTNLLFSGPDGIPRILLVTSAVSGEGKTTLAVNLAMACAKAGQRVALVDADLRRPMVSSYLEIDGSKGLCDVLAGNAPLDAALKTIGDGRVDVLPAGAIPANPAELVGSLQMREVMERLGASHDVVIVDAPPVLPVADALVMAGRVEGVVLVTRLGETTRGRLLSARDAIRKVKGNLVGVVPNAVALREDSAYSYAYRPGRHGDAYYKAAAAVNGTAPIVPITPDAVVDSPPSEASPEAVVTPTGSATVSPSAEGHRAESASEPHRG